MDTHTKKQPPSFREGGNNIASSFPDGRPFRFRKDPIGQRS